MTTNDRLARRANVLRDEAYSWKAVERTLNKEGFRTTTGKKFKSAYIQTIVSKFNRDSLTKPAKLAPVSVAAPTAFSTSGDRVKYFVNTVLTLDMSSDEKLKVIDTFVSSL